MSCRIIGIGDNVADKYLSRGVMYPGGQAVNVAVYAKMNGAETAYLGKFGSDAVAAYNQQVLEKLGIDFCRSRHFEGENGYARVTLENNDRVFLGSNKGGIAKEKPYAFTEEDFAYIRGFDLAYTNLNSYIEEDLPALRACGVPIAFDFSVRWNDEYLRQVCPHVDVVTLSCSHLNDEARKTEMRKAQAAGAAIVLGTLGEDGSWALYKDRWLYQPAYEVENIADTMGAGDSYLAAFLVSMLEEGPLLAGDDETVAARIVKAMDKGARFAVQCCRMEGAFGHGTPITE